MRCRQPAAGADQDLDDLVPSAPPGPHPATERLALDKLHGDPDLVAVGADIVDRDHVRVGEPGERLGLAQQPGARGHARLAGLRAAGVICEIMREDGEMARRPELEQFAEKHGLLLISVADMIAYRLQREQIVRRQAHGAMRPGSLPPGEPFAAYYYDTHVEDTEYLALVRGDVVTASAKGETVLVRVAAMEPLCDPFALRPDLDAAIKAIDDAGCGVLLYVVNRGRMRLRHSFERVVGLTPRESSVSLAKPSSEALRDFGLGAQVLADLGLKKIRLMIHSDRKIAGIEGFGIEVVDRVPIPRTAFRNIKAQ